MNPLPLVDCIRKVREAVMPMYMVQLLSGRNVPGSDQAFFMEQEIVNQINQLFSLSSRTAVVIGAGGGIGAAIAAGLAAYGAKTVCVDINETGIRKTAAAIEAANGSCEVRVTDIMNEASLAGLVKSFASAEILVVTPAILVRKHIVDQSEAEFDKQVQLNVKGTFNVVKNFGREMASRGRGTIIGFSSVRASVVEPGAGVYAATKAAVCQLLRTLASELGPQGVRVNLIAPSPVETPLTADLQSKGDAYAITAARSMLRRWAKPEDFVGPAVFLASDASAFVTGAELFIDGGWTASDGLDRLG